MSYREATAGWPRERCECGLEVVWELQRTRPGDPEYRWQTYTHVGPYDAETGERHHEYTSHRISARRASVGPQRAVAVIPEAEVPPAPVSRQQPPSEPSRERPVAVPTDAEGYVDAS